ncbi:MAG: hypothetical protein OJF49_000890 [Ktedonobacterales bacterium]|jgi:signal transduction histidine kinase|nr:MAG: hypothetical protein OJF49_000890 [Ktedonobacterales bacterium]
MNKHAGEGFLPDEHPPNSEANQPLFRVLVSSPYATVSAERQQQQSADSEPRPNSVQRLWHAMLRWLGDNSFVIEWLPPPWRILASYFLAVGLIVLATSATLLIYAMFPTFSFPSALEMMVIALVALSLGAGPSILATLTGLVTLEVIVLPSTSHGGFDDAGDFFELALFLVVGVTISIIASRVEHGRKQAVGDRADALARELVTRQTNERMDEFLSIASHELRTPLTGIKTSIQLAQRRLKRLSLPESVDQQDLLAPTLEVLDIAKREVDRQTRLVGDLLDISRIRANKLEYHLRDCDLVTIVREAVEAQRLAAPARVFHFDEPTERLIVHADPDRISQVITNFLTNAHKYSPADQPIAVRVKRKGAYARVLVRDHGLGLTAEEQAQIWQRFHRVASIKAQNDSGGGLGLGLFICKSIVEHHQGRVGLRSARGRGSTFWFTLPLL